MKTIEVCIGHDRSQSVRVRLSLLIIDDLSGDELSEQLISFIISPGDDLRKIRAEKEAHLAMPAAQSGIKGGPWPNIPDAEWQKVVDVIGVLHTPEVVKKHAVQG